MPSSRTCRHREEKKRFRNASMSSESCSVVAPSVRDETRKEGSGLWKGLWSQIKGQVGQGSTRWRIEIILLRPFFHSSTSRFNGQGAGPVVVKKRPSMLRVVEGRSENCQGSNGEHDSRGARPLSSGKSKATVSGFRIRRAGS